MFEFEKPKIEILEKSDDNKYGRFVIEPLERGYGTTLGNSLRRVMLSSLPGTAVSFIKIKGVLHEFSSLPGIKEDVTEIVMNIKELCIKNNSTNDDPKTGYIDASGDCVVKAGDIHIDGDLEILNPDLVIANLNGPEAHLEMELTITNGRGYVSADKNKEHDNSVDMIAVDSIYTPIVNALNDAVKCDEFDNQPNDKGKVAPKFRKKNADRLANFRTILINAANETTDADKKLFLANAYINSSESPLFAEALKAGDPYLGYAQFFAAAAYYKMENWQKTAEFAEKAIKCEDVKENAEQYLVSALTKNLKTKADTLSYLKKLNDINADKYMAQIASLYNQIGESQLSEKILNDAIAKDPNNKMAYAIKGENAMSDKKWDDAIKYFKKTVEIDPAFTAVWFNLGVCASSKGFDLNEQLSENGRITAENDAKVKEVLKEAAGYYEKVRELDPNREAISNWPYQLRMIYNALGETDKANEISKMLGE